MHKTLIRLVICCVFVFILVRAERASAQLDVRYEPSNPAVVTTMLDMADVTGKDVVYDLGCGDGRIVITAASQYGARGIGVDLDPDRIAESNENAKQAGVTDRVRFVEMNLFDTDIADATVMALFLWPSVNLRLRPKLFAELKPGVRIVSHEHDMGHWLPDRTTVVKDGDTSHVVYLWVLPANVSGTWEWNDSVPAGGEYALTVTQSYQRLAGTIDSNRGPIQVSDLTISGDAIRFVSEERTGAGSIVRVFDGIVTGDAIAGHYMTDTPSGLRVRSWYAKRDPSTVNAIVE